MSSKVIRTEAHELPALPQLRADVARTIAAYRRAVRALCGVLLVHWPEISRASSKCLATEALFHATAKRPRVRYAVLDRMLGRMPSYLRRAAIEHALGAVSSFLSNYENWLADTERERGSRPPRLGFANVFPSLYGGNMILVEAGCRSVRVKLLGGDGQWRFSDPLKLRGRLKRLTHTMELSPALVQRGAKVWLACPVECKRPKFTPPKSVDRVCSIDVGINTAATAAIVDSAGTVIARKFLTCGRHNAQRDALAAQIADKQRQSRGGIGRRLGRGFCQGLHRRIAGISLEAARQLAREIMEFAGLHGAKALVVENLKGWKPKGRGREQRKRFHRFQHRMLIKHLGFKAEELGMKLLEVRASGTSAFAYDGSGRVKRHEKNAALATFAGGKQYNADLNAAYNIAARGIALLHGIKKNASAGKRPAGAARTPLVLADIWARARVAA